MERNPAPLDHPQPNHPQPDHSQIEDTAAGHARLDPQQLEHHQSDHSQLDHSQPENTISTTLILPIPSPKQPELKQIQPDPSTSKDPGSEPQQLDQLKPKYALLQLQPKHAQTDDHQPDHPPIEDPKPKDPRIDLSQSLQPQPKDPQFEPGNPKLDDPNLIKPKLECLQLNQPQFDHTQPEHPHTGNRAPNPHNPKILELSPSQLIWGFMIIPRALRRAGKLSTTGRRVHQGKPVLKLAYVLRMEEAGPVVVYTTTFDDLNSLFLLAENPDHWYTISPADSIGTREVLPALENNDHAKAAWIYIVELIRIPWKSNHKIKPFPPILPAESLQLILDAIPR
ncbi:hypothetical protein B0J17DRAFT_631684 [Rhizoctonia solani]|nr:hypothetical protein B0J17DRAFT_631684 [Rhizoctonia solani]